MKTPVIPKSWITIGVVILVVLIGYLYIRGAFNTMVGLDEGVAGQWSQVENV